MEANGGQSFPKQPNPSAQVSWHPPYSPTQSWVEASARLVENGFTMVYLKWEGCPNGDWMGKLMIGVYLVTAFFLGLCQGPTGLEVARRHFERRRHGSPDPAWDGQRRPQYTEAKVQPQNVNEGSKIQHIKQQGFYTVYIHRYSWASVFNGTLGGSRREKKKRSEEEEKKTEL